MRPPIRPMRRSDAASVAELTTELGYPTSAADAEERFAALAVHPHDAVLVATNGDDEPIGWVHVARVALLQSVATAEIHGLVVASAYRSSGIGTALVAAAEAWARERGAQRIVVRSRSTRERAHRFYERLGYDQEKVSHVFGKPLV